MAYLLSAEYTKYCGGVTVTDEQVEYASGLIDAIIGKTLVSTETTELVNLKNNKGKLRYNPVISITDVKGVTITCNGVSESALPLTSVYVMDNYGHFQFFPNVGINSIVWGSPETLKVTYNYGYSVIPTDIKVVCGSIAKNIANMEAVGGISGAKSIASLDFNIAMFDDRLFSSNEILILQKYKEV